MNVQVVGPSRISSGTGFIKSSDRQRQLASNQKAERVLGAHAPASFLKIDSGSRGNGIQSTSSNVVSLDSPVSKCPTSFLPWSDRLPTCTSITTLNDAEPGQSPSSGTLSSVPPLNFKRRPHRRSFSMAKIETEMTDYKRDATFTLGEPTMHLSQADSHLQRLGEPCITRRQSLPDTALTSGECAVKRHPRPLPPVPLSRPASPASSSSSYTSHSHSGPRPLPTPPTLPLLPNISPITFAPGGIESSPIDSLPLPSTPPRVSNWLVPSATLTPPSNGPFSPLSPLSIITDLPNALRNSTSPRSAEARRRHRIHASPYKLARNPTRYSTTSLSSQVSVSPVPSAAELRRRNRDKMAKLIRVLGESPPSDLVFSAESERINDRHERSITEEEPVESKPLLILEPLRRSVSLGIEEPTSLFGKKKALSDPDAGHGVRAQSPTAARSATPSSFLRRRSKKGRADKDKAPRYVVSLFDTGESKPPERLTFKLNVETPKMRPTGSYLRGAYKKDVMPVEVKLPPLPTLIPGIDVPKPSQKWVRETAHDRWEVDDYENVVMSLRKL